MVNRAACFDELAQGYDVDSSVVSVGKVAAIANINDVINFAVSIAERLPTQSYVVALFVLWCASGLIGIISSRRRSALLQKQIDKLSHDVRQLEVAESRRLIESLNSSRRSNPGALET
jgi:hypothetical protein